MTTLYEALESSPDASQEQLQQAYRRAARRLHPDVNPGAEADQAMRALNDAWAILGNPERRRRYDAELAPAGASPIVEPPPAVSSPDEDDGLVDHRRSRLLRPSVVILAVLAIIFIVTAYAAPSNRRPRSPFTTVPAPTPVSSRTGPNQGSPEPPQASITQGGPGSGTDLVGKCILRLLGYDGIVVCNQRGAQTIVAEVASTSDCPLATTAYQLEGRSQLVCLSAANGS